MSQDYKDNTDLAASADTSAGLPETYQPLPSPSLPPDTTNHFFPILRRRKMMVLGISLLCFGTCLMIIENKISTDSPRIQTAISSPIEAPRTTEHPENTQINKKPPTAKPQHNAHYIEAKKLYNDLKTHLSAFINKDGSIDFYNEKNAAHALHSEKLTLLLKQQKTLTNTVETLSKRYGEKHPKMIDARAKLAAISAQITEERETLLGQLIDDYIAAKTKFDALKLKEQKEQEERQQQESRTVKTTPIYTEKAPTVTSAPLLTILNKPQLIGLSALLSLLLGTLIPVIIERCRKTFINGQQLSHFFGLPCYALIPKTDSEKHKNLADYVLNNPASTLVEALHSLRLNIKLNSPSSEAGDKVILVTSSKADEGKTMLSTWLARLAAKTGERVLLIDANLRDPSVHKALNGKNTLSLVEYLTGKATLNKVIDKTDTSGLHAIYGRSIPNSVLDLLSSDKMGALLREVRKSYDLIIIDTPSCLINADTRALSPHADLLLYLVGWNKTKRNVIHKGLSQFISFSRIRTALILSNIDIKKHIEYGYGEVICEDEA